MIMQENHNPLFKGVWIPKEIWTDERLTWFMRCLWATIDSLSTPEHPCTASNQWLADRMGSSAASIGNQIHRLRDLGLIVDIPAENVRKILATFDGDKRLKKRSRPLNHPVKPPSLPGYDPLTTQLSPPPSGNIHENKERVPLRSEGVFLSEKDVAPTIYDAMPRIGQIFKRPAGTAWAYDELNYLSEVSKDPSFFDDLSLVEKLYSTQDRSKLPRTVRSLLQNWTSACDRARNPENERSRNETTANQAPSRNIGTHNDGDVKKYAPAFERMQREIDAAAARRLAQGSPD